MCVCACESQRWKGTNKGGKGVAAFAIMNRPSAIELGSTVLDMIKFDAEWKVQYCMETDRATRTSTRVGDKNKKKIGQSRQPISSANQKRPMMTRSTPGGLMA